MIQKYANPARFNRLAARLMPWFAWPAGALILGGLYFALVASPADYQQGETVRIMYVHVPSAWMALFVYSSMAIASAVGLIWKHPLAHLSAEAAAPIGACFTFSLPVYRIALGQTHVGHLVGLGCPAYIRPGSVLSVSWVHGLEFRV